MKLIGIVAIFLACVISGCSGTTVEQGVPEEILRLNVLGTAYLGQQKWAEAEESFRKALERRPTEPLLLNNAAVALVQQGRIDEAEALLREAIATEADYPYAHYNLGSILKNRGEFEPAAEHFELVERFNSNDLMTHYNLGIVYSRIGREVEAEAEYRRSLELDPTHVSSLYALGRLLLQKGEQEEGVTLISLSQEIRARSGLDEAVGSQYGEQGPYAMGIDYSGDALAAPEAIDVRFSKSGPPAGSIGDLPSEAIAIPTGGPVLAVVAADVDNDETVEIVSLSIDDDLALKVGVRRDGVHEESAVIRGFPIEQAPNVMTLTAVDRDHDGDIDLFACWAAAGAGGCVLGTNDGTGIFELRDSADHGFAPAPDSSDTVRVGFSDIDNDRDIDLLVAHSGRVGIYSNQRDGTFADVSDEAGLGSATTDVTGHMAIADVNKDGWMDLVLGVSGGTRFHLNRLGQFEAGMSFAGKPELVERSVVFDHDNDGFLDLVRSAEDGFLIHRNLGAGEWETEGELVSDPGGGVPLAAYDADGDGDLDLVTGSQASEPTLWTNDGGNANHWVSVSSSGIADNKSGVGSKVEFLAGALRQKFEITGPLPIHMGLGTRSTVESVRYLWPSGILQDEINLKTGAVVDVVQLVNNQLQEVIWLDQIELIAVDHPRGTEVFPNERLMPGPPWPEFDLFVSDDVRPVAAARAVEQDRDLADVLAHDDRRYVQGFDLLPHKGYAEEHTIELDLGEFGTGDRVVLLLDGWIDYADSSANLAAHQAGHRLQPPRLTVADGRGGWLETGHLMGFPAGLPKTMAVELSGLFPSRDHRLRIATNMRLYWDRARVLVAGSRTPTRIHRQRPIAAELRFGGYPAEASADGVAPFGYDPTDVDSSSPWTVHVGRYTAFGDVRGQLLDIDDDFVTTRSGDEIELRFDSPGPVEDGWTRTYLFFADGFGKDMDLNSAANMAVGPIPFHGMPSYPYPEDVTPPLVTRGENREGRWILTSPRGWPGAVPQPLVTDRDADAP
jgi:Flp pilus assembly protein TadD